MESILLSPKADQSWKDADGLRGRGCGCVSVTECAVVVAEKGGAGAVGGWREGPGVQREVV